MLFKPSILLVISREATTPKKGICTLSDLTFFIRDRCVFGCADIITRQTEDCAHEHSVQSLPLVVWVCAIVCVSVLQSKRKRSYSVSMLIYKTSNNKTTQKFLRKTKYLTTFLSDLQHVSNLLQGSQFLKPTKDLYV